MSDKLRYKAGSLEDKLSRHDMLLRNMIYILDVFKYPNGFRSVQTADTSLFDQGS
jgi:hypothetical protein